jgi:hypothetical protein
LAFVLADEARPRSASFADRSAPVIAGVCCEISSFVPTQTPSTTTTPKTVPPNSQAATRFGKVDGRSGITVDHHFYRF